MKKLLVIGIALFAVLIFVMPAAAESKLELGGYYRFQGRYESNPQLDEDQNAGGAHVRHLFRFAPAFIVSENLRFDTKWDIFDGTTWGNPTTTSASNVGPKAKSRDAIDVDRVWMTVTTPFGKIAGGRMPAGAWGLTFGDDNEEADRLRFDTKFGNFSTGVIMQFNGESDWQDPNEVDQDNTTYYLYGVYKADFGAIGLLGAYSHSSLVTTATSDKYNLLPYFDLSFGKFGVRGELIWASGEIDPDLAGARTTDIEELAWNLEADVAFGPFKVTGGYAFVTGEDRDPFTNTEANTTYGGIGDDWDLLVILMDLEAWINGHAMGSFQSGVKLWYAQLDYKLNKAWRFWATVAGAEAETLDMFPAGTDDKIGTEYDVNFRWDIMKNLWFMGRLGYLDAGDFWKTATPGSTSNATRSVTNLDNDMSAYYELRIVF